MSLPDEPLLQPYLTVHDAEAAIDFYVGAFGFAERYRLAMPDGRVGHAELERGRARLLVADEFAEAGILGPKSRGGSTVGLMLYVEDVDAFVEAARAAGCEQEGATADQFFGDRAAKLRDPFGHRWFIHQRLEDLSPDQIRDRFAALMKKVEEDEAG